MFLTDTLGYLGREGFPHSEADLEMIGPGLEVCPYFNGYATYGVIITSYLDIEAGSEHGSVLMLHGQRIEVSLAKEKMTFLWAVGLFRTLDKLLLELLELFDSWVVACRFHIAVLKRFYLLEILM